MKKIFDLISEDLSKVVTEKYSTSFSIATKLIDNSIRQDIYNIYGFVRIADEIVDSFHQYPKKEILDKLEKDVYIAINQKISINPILNSFQKTVNILKISLFVGLSSSKFFLSSFDICLTVFYYYFKQDPRLTKILDRTL